MRIFLSTGEPSGDLHAANVIHAIRRLRPEAEFVGFGGPRMAEAGAKLLFPLVDLAVMWFLRVLLNLHKFVTLVNDADRDFEVHRPDAVILIDYPGFNWWIARRAKRRGIPVFYYVPPQIWAWASWRVNKVRRFVDHVLCSLPFEEPWYHARGVPQARWIGHPYFDEILERTVDESFVARERARGGNIVALLPGSRTQEVIRNFPIMMLAASKLVLRRPGVRFVVAALHDRHKARVETMIRESGLSLPIEVHAARTPELIRLADVAWAVSGSVGLELMMEALPSVVLYKVNRVDLLIARPFIKAKYISLVNLLAGTEVMPEYLTARDVSSELADWAERWLVDPEERQRQSTRLALLRTVVALPGASERAAEAIVGVIDPRVYRGPHERPDGIASAPAAEAGGNTALGE